jgi:iron-sulfur cluster assembly protein
MLHVLVDNQQTEVRYHMLNKSSCEYVIELTLHQKQKKMTEVIAQTQVISLTEGARTQLASIKKESNIPEDHILRVGVKGGGCSGFSYILGFDLPKEGDEIYDIDGVKVIMNKAHSIYLLGMEIDFVSGLDNRGFTFNNPNATSSCGCGTSFSA